MLFCRILLVLFIAACSVSAQTTDNYIPLSNYRIPKDSLKSIKTRFDAKSESLKGESRIANKFIAESYKELYGSFYSMDSAGLIMNDSIITGHIRKILNRVVTSNPLLVGNVYHVFTFRSSEANASNLGQGVVLFNLDMITKVKNEDQIASILCHEIAHDYLDHVAKRIKKTSDLLVDEEFLKEYKKASRQTYNSYAASEAVLNKILSKFSSNSRENELQADSLGFIFLINAGYSPNEGIKEVAFLDSVDLPLYRNDLDYKWHFNFSTAAFDSSWLDNTNHTQAWRGKQFQIPDSLKTHPDAKARAQALLRIAPSEKENIQPVRIEELRKVAFLELVAHKMDCDDYGDALFTIMQLKRIYPGNSFLALAMNRCLGEIYLAKKQYNFASVVEHPSRYYCKSYNDFLMFMHNLSLSDYKKIVNAYNQDYITTLNGSGADIAYVRFLIDAVNDQIKKPDDYLKSFQNSYGLNPYSELVKRRITLIKVDKN